jgi:hypothetical protein
VMMARRTTGSIIAPTHGLRRGGGKNGCMTAFSSGVWKILHRFARQGFCLQLPNVAVDDVK